MREADLEVLLRMVERRATGRARAGVGVGLGRAGGGAADRDSVRRGPALPVLRGDGAAALGHASGLRRYRCTACRKTFNALTGTSLARLRKKACWLRYGEALAAGMSLTKAAAHCGVHLTTSFRWRHRFLRAPTAARGGPGGGGGG